MDQEKSKTTTQEEHAVHSEITKKSKKDLKVFIGVVVTIAIVLGIIFYIGRSNSTPPSTTATPISTISPETVLVVVNGEEIVQATINERIVEAGQALISQGVNIDDPSVRSQIELQILEDTINYTLLKQGVIKAGTPNDSAKLEEVFQTFVVQAGGEDQLATQLQQAGLTEDAFRERLVEQLRIDAYIGANVAINDIVVSDEEISSFYDDATATGGGEIPPLDEIRDQITQQLIQQKQQELVLLFIDTLRENALIERK